MFQLFDHNISWRSWVYLKYRIRLSKRTVPNKRTPQISRLEG